MADQKHIIRFHFDTGAIIEGEYEPGSIKPETGKSLDDFIAPEDASNVVIDWNRARVLAVTTHVVEDDSINARLRQQNQRLAEALLDLTQSVNKHIPDIDQPEWRAARAALNRASEEINEYYD